MSKIKEIVREYANEYFTKEMLLSGDETWDLAALSWFDEHYPEMSDDDRLCFSSLLDRYSTICRMYVEDQDIKAMIAEDETPVYEGMTKRELRKKILEDITNHNFLNARQLIKTYYSL